MTVFPLSLGECLRGGPNDLYSRISSTNETRGSFLGMRLHTPSVCLSGWGEVRKMRRVGGRTGVACVSGGEGGMVWVIQYLDRVPYCGQLCQDTLHAKQTQVSFEAI